MVAYDETMIPSSGMYADDSQKTAVFVCTHHSGHLNPLTALVPLYVKAGYAVHFFCAKHRRDKLQKLDGLTFHEESLSYSSIQEATLSTIQDRFHLPLTDMAAGEFFLEQILPTTVAFLDDGFVDRVRSLRPTVMVCDVSSLWGILTAQILQVPLITSCSCTLFEEAALEPVFGFLRDLEVSKQCISWIRNKYSISYDAMYSYMNESGFTISWSLPTLQPPCRQGSETVHFFGTAMAKTIEQDLERAADKDRALGKESVVAFIENARATCPNVKIVYCTLGTVVGQEPWTLAGKKDGDMVTDFYDRVMETLGDRDDYRVILSIGQCRKIEDMPKIPENFFVSNFVPQPVVLKMVDVFITHCGNNSIHEAYFLGCPMLCVPVFGDQHPNAAMIEKLGAGVQIPSPFAPAPSPDLDHVTSRLLCSKLDEILVQRKQQIGQCCEQIKTEMQAQHAFFHSKAMLEMEDYIASEKKLVTKEHIVLGHDAPLVYV